MTSARTHTPPPLWILANAIVCVAGAVAGAHGLARVIAPWTGLPLLATALGSAAAVGAIPATCWDVTSTPDLAALAALVVSVDALQYVAHRAAHRAWRRTHAVHHAHVRPRVADAFDTHPVDALLQLVLPLLLALHLVRPTLATVTCFGAGYACWLLWLHDPKAHGGLSRLVVTPAYHRVHHTEPHRCLAHVFPLWDVLGGTT